MISKPFHRETRLIDVKKELDFGREMAGKMFANYYAGVYRVRNLRINAQREIAGSRTFLKLTLTLACSYRTAIAINIAVANGHNQEEENDFVADMRICNQYKPTDGIRGAKPGKKLFVSTVREYDSKLSPTVLKNKKMGHFSSTCDYLSSEQ